VSGIGAINVLIFVFLVSFGIDRAGKALLFIIGYMPYLKDRFPDPSQFENRASRVQAARKQTLLYFLFTGALAMLVLTLYGDVRLLRYLNVVVDDPTLDAIMTGLVLVAGSDFVGRLLQMSGIYNGRTEKSEPIEITGRLTLEHGEQDQTDQVKIKSKVAI
jgi:hypothetical protein